MASDRAPQLLEAGLSVARTLSGICFNGEDRMDCVLATARMSAAWQSRGKMPRFYVDNDGGGGVKRLGVASGKVVSRSRYVAVDSALEEDVCGSSISRRLCQKRNIDPLFSKSPVVIEIADIDDPQMVETTDLRRPGEPDVVGTYSIPPFVSDDASSASGPSSLGMTGVAPYLVVDVGRLRYMGVDLAKVAAVKSERDELAEKVWLLEEERHKIDERYLVLSGEKTVVEAQAVTLDGETRLVQVVDRVVKSSKFVLGIRRVKAACMAAGVEMGKQVGFFETDFMSYLRLGELGLVDLHQLCSE
ncbi:unnamed protein product [Lactuca saligna]|uniref:Uncharacterized protein n=1 Tax=Lactuca saligna TaxID=75948 RepID=A0AA35ZFJ1_LACSI|nr:unnamed protein product [Lactuca saligna]